MYTVEVVDSEEEFLSLEDEWRALVCCCPDVPHFLTWEFVSARWKHFADNRELFVLTARDPEGKLAGIAPWAIARESIGPFRIRRLEFLCRAENPAIIGPDDGEDLDIIAPSDVRSAVTASFFQHIDHHRSRWDVMDFAWLSPESSLGAYLKETGAALPSQTSTGVLANLPDSWATFEKTVLGKSESKQIRKDGRRLERDYPEQVVYHCITERGDVGPAMENLIEMNKRRWNVAGQATPFDDERHTRFHRDYAERAFDRGWLRFYQIVVGDRIIAADCNVVLHRTQYSMQTGFEPDWAAYSPGKLIQAFEVARAIDEGVHNHDLAHGALETKRIWANAEREDIRLIANNSWKGMLYSGKETGLSRVKTLAKRLLPQSTYFRVKRVALRLRQAVLRGR